MQGEAHLTLNQIRDVTAIVVDVLDHWDDPACWRQRFLQGACELTRAHIGTVTGQTLTPDRQMGKSVPIAVFGMDEAMQKKLFAVSVEMASNKPIDAIEAAGAPGMEVLFDEFAKSGWATLRRSDTTDDGTYHASMHHRYRERADCDDYVISVRGVDQPNRIEVLTVDRRPTDSRFAPNEVALLKLLHDEVAPLIGVRLTTEEHLCRDGLSRRLRDTLQCLLEGSSEKEAAKSLGLGVRTIHQYVAMLYKHFHVRTRAELMAYFVKRQPRTRTYSG